MEKASEGEEAQRAHQTLPVAQNWEHLGLTERPEEKEIKKMH